MTKAEAYKQVACNYLLELTEDGNDMSWKQIVAEVEKAAVLEQKANRIKTNFDKKFKLFD